MMRLRPSTGQGPDETIPGVLDAEAVGKWWGLKHSWTSLTIYLVALAEGLTHLAALAILYFLKDDLRLTPPEVSMIFIAPAIPWFLKPAMAFLSDTYPIFGMRRKPYLLFFSFTESIGFVLLATVVSSVGTAVFALVVISASAAFCSTIAEALVVETSGQQQHSHASDYVSDYVSFKAVGSLAVAFLSGYLLEKAT
eukprot:GHVN01077874.1.p1 GENE.GHVN01077874.1~~GHVN01077874.1.p1  ORF type:complete len:196 (-),score=10.87 GHVN01077874.1:344-931(-)